MVGGDPLAWKYQCRQTIKTPLKHQSQKLTRKAIESLNNEGIKGKFKEDTKIAKK